MKATSILHWTVRIAAALLLISGAVVWTGSADVLIPIHILLGVVLTIALLVLTYRGFAGGVARGLVVGVLIVSLVLPVLGMTQSALVPESLAWVAQIVHLALGLGAWALAETLFLRLGKKGS